MFLDLTSFSFGSSLNDGTGTPSWSTSLGQRKGYRFTVNGADSIITGMVYCSVPLGSISLSLGKGGEKIPNAQDSQECQIASKFEQVYINGKKVGSSFLMVLIKENSKGIIYLLTRVLFQKAHQNKKRKNCYVLPLSFIL